MIKLFLCSFVNFVIDAVLDQMLFLLMVSLISIQFQLTSINEFKHKASLSRKLIQKIGVLYFSLIDFKRFSVDRFI